MWSVFNIYALIDKFVLYIGGDFDGHRTVMVMSHVKCIGSFNPILANAMMGQFSSGRFQTQFQT